MDRPPEDTTSGDMVREAKQWLDPDEGATPRQATRPTTTWREPARSDPFASSSQTVRERPPQVYEPAPPSSDSPWGPVKGGLARIGGGILLRVVLGLVILGAVGIYTWATRPDTTDLFSLTPGTCAVDPGLGLVDEVETVDCNKPHDLEVFALVTLPYGEGAAMPDDDTLWSVTFDTCRPFFDTYVGRSYEDSKYWIDGFVPDRHGWKAGDREVVCVLFESDGSGEIVPTAGTARGTAA